MFAHGQEIIVTITFSITVCYACLHTVTLYLMLVQLEETRKESKEGSRERDEKLVAARSAIEVSEPLLYNYYCVYHYQM